MVTPAALLLARNAPELFLDKSRGDYWPAVVKAFEDNGCTEEDALRNLRLARILQVGDWDADNETPILYEPPTGQCLTCASL